MLLAVTEEATPSRRKRPVLIVGAALLLLALLLLAVGAAVLPRRAPSLLAAGLESTRSRVDAAFGPEVGEPLRAAVRSELAAQAAWLRSLPALSLSPERARAAAAPAERLTDLLADERFTAADCRSFLELSRRSRREAPEGR